MVNSILVFLLGLSNGLVVSYAMTEGPARCKERNRAFVGFLMYFAVVLGLVLGSTGSWVVRLLKFSE